MFALPNDVLATMQVRAPAQRDQHIHVPMVYDSQCSVFSVQCVYLGRDEDLRGGDLEDTGDIVVDGKPFKHLPRVSTVRRHHHTGPLAGVHDCGGQSGRGAEVQRVGEVVAEGQSERVERVRASVGECEWVCM